MPEEVPEAMNALRQELERSDSTNAGPVYGVNFTNALSLNGVDIPRPFSAPVAEDRTIPLDSVSRQNLEALSAALDRPFSENVPERIPSTPVGKFSEPTDLFAHSNT